MANFLVTGGAGFIGSNLVRVLLGRGDKVRVLDDFSTGKRENLDFPDTAGDLLANLEVLEGDMATLSTCREAAEGMEYVLHQAAIPSVPRSIALPLESNRANIDGTLNLLVAARDAGVKRLVFASSSAIYGNAPGFPREETITPQPLSPYAVQKMTAEHYLRVFYELYGLETVSLRYFNVFGPHQDPNSEYAAVIPRFMKQLEWFHRELTDLLLVDDLHDRKRQLISNVDAVVALPGGSGTLDELLEAISLKRLGAFVGPIVMVNTRGFFDPCIQLLERCIEERFMDPRHRSIWQVVDDPEEVIEAFRAAPAWSSDALKFAAI